MSNPADGYDELHPRDRTALGLIALLPGGVQVSAMMVLFRVAGLTPGTDSDALTYVDLKRRLRSADIPLEDIAAPAFAIKPPHLRRVAIDGLVSSGLAARWAQAFNAGQVNRLWSSTYSHEVPPVIAIGIGLAMLGGASIDVIRQACQRLGDHTVADAIDQMAANIVVAPVDDLQVGRLHASVQLYLCVSALERALRQPSTDSNYWMGRIPNLIEPLGINAGQLPALYQHGLLLQDPAVLERYAPDLPFAKTAGVAQALLLPDAGQALRILKPVYDAQHPLRGNARPPLPGWLGVIHALALAASAGADEALVLGKLLRASEPTRGNPYATAIGAVQQYAQAVAAAQLWLAPAESAPPLVHGWVLLVLHKWSGTTPAPALKDWALQVLPVLRAIGWDWLAQQFAAATGDSAAQPAGAWLWRQPEASWQRALRAIQGFARPEQDGASSTRHHRIRANLNPDPRSAHLLRIELRELKPLAKGGYSSGRRLEPGKPVHEILPRLDPDDAHARTLLAAWERLQHVYDDQFTADTPVLDELFGYPYLVTGDGNDKPLTLLKQSPRLRIQRLANAQVKVDIDPAPRAQARRRLDWQDTRLSVTEFDNETLRLASALGSGTEFPESQIPALLALTPQLGRRIEVDADIGAAETVADLDTRIHVLIEALKEGLRMRLRTQPLGSDGMFFVPGAGSTDILGLRDGKPVRAHRQLRDEQDQLDRLLGAVPLLAGGETGDPIDLPNPEAALETLSQLTELGDTVVLDWSNQRKWSLTRSQSSTQLSVKVKAQRDWFSAEGGLTLDDGQVVSLATLLEALPSSQGRFVRLADDRIVALSQDLARQLKLIRALADERGRLQVAPVAAAMLQPLMDSGAHVDLDDAFEAQLQRIADAEHTTPELPANLQAELRDYQIEGYRWLMRLASWGAGACLADDMGLGKTLQALAAVLARSSQGATLVIAPTSVVPNWRNEARRFAPSLDVRLYGEGNNRSTALANLGPGCVVLVSYGLLTMNIEAFAQQRFATLVLDEAQAIKNAAAQRSQAIRQLQADFRIATTGTPIENHLGELWSLMRVLNPGLLGSQEHFSQRFMTPIELDPRGPERDTLRRLISPFMLRRLKSQVLTELPPRTEIVLTIQPSAAEAQLLAAIRRQAIDRIGTAGAPEEAKRFHVLAEIMRLRRAACHPSLVAPELNLSGAKLEQLLELVAELKENRHRALVFSQFVDYLDIVRAAFDQAGIRYQYLDGSTSSKAREAAVHAFQAGDGDVFLLSLRAGGVGLNLTAADYVIHLDPWWNPAVEQQATDRAHRIGQTRPVTVYKLVVAGSIEEQILALHGNKREIADSVLAGQDGGTTLSVSELVGLLEAELDA